MRSSFVADWAFGIVGAIEKTVRNIFPAEIKRWPILQAFNFEGYSIGADYFIIILRDKLSGMPAGPGTPQEFPYKDHPSLPVSRSNVKQWLSYLERKLELRIVDVAMILPIHDSGHNSAAADYDIFNPQEREIWDYELNFAIARQMTGLGLSKKTSPAASSTVTYNISGNNARVNINSTDYSINIASETSPELFSQMIDALQLSGADVAQAKLEASIEEMRSNYGTPGFSQSYTAFMSVLADHITVFGSIIAPFLPALSKLLG